MGIGIPCSGPIPCRTLWGLPPSRNTPYTSRPNREYCDALNFGDLGEPQNRLQRPTGRQSHRSYPSCQARFIPATWTYPTCLPISCAPSYGWSHKNSNFVFCLEQTLGFGGGPNFAILFDNSLGMHGGQAPEAAAYCSMLQYSTTLVGSSP